MQVVEVPELGEVEFPDGMTDEEMADAITRHLRERVSVRVTFPGINEFAGAPPEGTQLIAAPEQAPLPNPRPMPLPEPILPTQAAARVMQFMQTPLTRYLPNPPAAPRIPGTRPEDIQYQRMVPAIEQTQEAITGLAEGMTAPMNLALMAGGMAAPEAAPAMGRIFAGPMTSDAMRAAKEGNVSQAVVSGAMAGAGVAHDVAPLVGLAKDYGVPIAKAALEATRDTLDFGGGQAYKGIERQIRDRSLGGDTVEPRSTTAALAVSELNREAIPASQTGSLNAGSILTHIINPAKVPIDAIRVERGLQQGRQFVANAPDLIGEWVERFKNNRLAQKIYSPKDIASLEKGLRATAAIFGDQYPDPVPGASPARENIDFGITLDSTTICPQQDQYLAMIRAVERGRGEILDPWKRFLVGRMMLDAGESPACWFCYGQSARDVADWYVLRTADIIKRAGELLAATPNPPNEQLQEIFGTWTPIKPGGKDSFLLAIVRKYAGNPQAAAFLSDPVRMRDVIYAGEEPRNPVEEDVAKAVKDSIRGMLHVNVPKGFAEYRGQILTLDDATIRNANEMAGVRMNSQTDFRVWHILETEKMLTHLAMRGAMAHVYTRIPEFIDIFGRTGIKFNISFEFAHDGKTGKILRDARGNPVINEMNTMPWKKILEFRRKYPNDVGSMLTALTEEDILEGMRNPNVDMMIPYHQGRVDPRVRGFMQAQNFEKWQHERWPAGYQKGQKVSVKLSNGKTVIATVGEPFTRAQHFNSKKLYIELCNKLGVTPRYDQFKNQPGYMKAIIDVARFPSAQRIVDPTRIDWKAAARYAEEWAKEGGDQPQIDAKPALLKYVLDRIENDEWPAAPMSETFVAEKDRAAYNQARKAADEIEATSENVSVAPRSPRTGPARRGFAQRPQSGVRLEGIAIDPIRALKAQGYVDVRGQRASTPEQVAKVAQAFRNPAFEVFHILYTKGGKVVAHEAFSSRMPGFAQVVPREAPAKFFYDIRDRIRRLEADEVYLIHNHPSRKITPSSDDAASTARFMSEIPEVKGHVVIDDKQFSWIRPTPPGNFPHFATRFGGMDIEIGNMPAGPRNRTDPFFRRSGRTQEARSAISASIRGPHDLALIGSSLRNPSNTVSVIYRDSSGTVRAIESVPIKLFNRPKEFADWVRGRVRTYGGAQVLAYYDNANFDINAAAVNHIRNGTLLDAVVGGRSLSSLGVQTSPGMQFGLNVKDLIKMIRVAEGAK